MPADEIIEAWMTSTEDAFYAIKSEFGLDDSWKFSIASPDVVPEDAASEALNDLTGAAAFTLRRIQALRHLLKGQPWKDMDQLRMLASYVGELNAFYLNLEQRELLTSKGMSVIEHARAEMRRLAADIALAMQGLRQAQ